METYFLDIAKILYIESVDRKTFVYTGREVYESDFRLYELEAQLEKSGFLRANKSCLIQLKHIKSLRADIDRRIRVTMENGEQIIVSRQYAEGLKRRLGAEGLSSRTMMQFLLVSALVVGERYLFFTDAIIKRLSLPLRTAGMVVTAVFSIAVCIVVFGWFPVDVWQAWAMFFLCFGACFCLSVVIMSLRERAENRKMEQALERLKRESKN